MGVAAILLLVVNVVYATSPVVTRLVLDDVPPITLALLRLVLGAAVLVPFGRGARATPAGQGARVFWMGALGFAAAVALSLGGIAGSSATNAAILVVVCVRLAVACGAHRVWACALARVGAARAAPFLSVQPVVGALLGGIVLGEPVTRFTAIGGALVAVGLWMTVTGRR